ncbi:helix-turn-helix transcriptional regulator [Colwellia psychrerythraea]|uniref:helix-turn-helix transcriptional regulator n=1 Tax=Colwellia psychrerythraea TaxID=28229 RepID=UPI000A5D848A|nr:AlpA family transcriptional regulator [Colwellia psychrerythraea]
MKSILATNDILNRYGVGRQTLWRWRKKDNFPVPVSPPLARPFWRLEDIELWETSNTSA